MYLEDLPMGTRWSAGEFATNAEEALEFSSRYDPQPMHIDPEAAAKGRFGELIASGWHTAALVMGALARARLFGDTEVLGLGVDQLQWPTPVRFGDVMKVDVEVVGSRASESKPGFGIVKLKTIARNQRDEVVLSMTSNCWVPRRPV
jgi:acyl dehydratase